jgi:hypothetical protein
MQRSEAGVIFYLSRQAGTQMTWAYAWAYVWARRWSTRKEDEGVGGTNWCAAKRSQMKQ